MSITKLPSDTNEQGLFYPHQTIRAYDFETSLFDLLEIQGKKNPHRISIIDDQESITFQELLSSINNLASYLHSRGIGQGTHIGISIPRSSRSIVSVFALLKLGAVYVPLDPNYPRNRIEYMIEDSNVEYILVNYGSSTHEDTYADKLIYIDDYCGSRTKPLQDVKPEFTDVIYLLYTSGSTGVPKGILGSHSGLLNRCHWMWETYPFDAHDVCCHKTTLNFVDSLWEIFGSLLQGIKLVVINESDSKNISRFKKRLNASHVTRLVLVPSLLEALLTDDEKLTHLKICICSGEVLSPHLARQFKQAYPNTRLLNLYGSTEVAGDVIYYDLDEWSDTELSVPIGKPISNTFAYILDKTMAPVALGEEGKLYVAGLNIALGYWKNAEETRQKFTRDHWTDTPMYCMDDWARYRKDGNIEYLGRHDEQIKIRGVRVELGEIKNTLLKHPEVKDAIVRVVKKEKNTLLIGYVVLTHTEHKAQFSQKILQFLAEYLPPAFIPNAIIVVDAFSLTPNGKVDMKTLPDILDTAF